MRRISGALAAAMLLSGAATGLEAGPFVEWLGDGTVLLKLGPDFDDTILETSRAELGSAFGPDQRPFEGKTVRLLTQDEGVKGAISGPIVAFEPIWEELTGAQLEVDLLPVTELYAATMLDLQRGHGYDTIVIPASFYGDLIAGDFMAPVEPLMAQGRFPRWSYDAMPPALRNLYTWEGKGYGVLNDADGQVLYYRRDVLTDPKWQASFKERHGYDLPVPPATWQQVQDIAGFFDGENWDAGDGQADSGMVLHLKQGEQGHYHFQSLAAAFAVTPGPEVDRHHNVFFFDPEDMRPLINSPGHVAALELLQALNETGPVEQIGWRLPQAWEYFLRGKAVMTFSWGDLGSLCQDESRSGVKGKCGTAILPGSQRQWDHAGQAWIESPTPQPVGNTTGGSWHGVVTRQSANQEAAYSFLALMAIPPVSAWNGRTGWTGVDPGFAYQMLPPAGTARLADYIKAGWDRADAEDYLGAYARNYNAPTMLPYLRLRGTAEYFSALDSELAAALGGRKTAQEALDDAAAAWDEITDRLGRQQQLEAHRKAIGYRSAGSG